MDIFVSIFEAISLLDIIWYMVFCPSITIFVSEVKLFWNIIFLTFWVKLLIFEFVTIFILHLFDNKSSVLQKFKHSFVSMFWYKYSSEQVIIVVYSILVKLFIIKLLLFFWIKFVEKMFFWVGSVIKFVKSIWFWKLVDIFVFILISESDFIFISE